jgi:hypothetical protein
MHGRRLIMAGCVLAVSLGLGLWRLYGGSVRAKAEAPGETKNLFDHQDHSSGVPAPRARPEHGASNGPARRGLGSVPADWAVPPAERARRLGLEPEARPGETIEAGRRSYRWAPSIVALSRKAPVPAGAEVVEQRSGFAFIRLELGTEPPKGALPVVFEPVTGQLYVVTGKLSVHLKSAAVTQSLSQDFSLELVTSIERLNRAIYKTSKPWLRRDERVVEANLELIGQPRVAQ